MDAMLISAYACVHAGAARQAFLAKAETPATSDVDEALTEAAGAYIALLLGLVNAPLSLPKPAAAGDAPHADAAELLHPLATPSTSLQGAPSPDMGSTLCCKACQIFLQRREQDLMGSSFNGMQGWEALRRSQPPSHPQTAARCPLSMRPA